MNIKNMNILFIATVYNHLAAFHKPFIKSFQDKGYQVHVAGSNSMGRKQELEQLGVVCHDISFDKKILSQNNKKAIKELNNLFSSIKFDLIHVHTPIAAFLVRFVLRKKKNQGSLLYTAHGFHFFEGAPLRNWLLFYTAEKIAKKWTDGIIVMNEEDLNLAKKMNYQLNENLFFVNGVGVDFDEFNEKTLLEGSIRDELKLNENAVVVSCVAELSRRKNQMFILRNWENISEKAPDTHLLLIGEGNDEELLKAYVVNENLNNIHFLGFRKDIPKILKETDIVILTSLHEGLPRCLMEAAVLGKPMVATNVRGSRDIVEDGKNGYLVDVNDGTILCNKLIDLSINQENRIAFGENAKVKSNIFSIEYVLEQMDKIYSKFL